MKRIILIDNENISQKEFENVTNLRNYKLVLFETKNTTNKKIPLTLAVKLSKSKIKFEVLSVDVKGKNALDFQICAYAGKINKRNNEIFILSKDKGFDNLKTFNIHRIESFLSLNSIVCDKKDMAIKKIKSLIMLKSKKYCNIEKNCYKKVQVVLSEVCNKYSNDVEFINDIMKGINENDKVFINNAIQKKFRSSDVATEKRLYKSLISITI